MTSPTVRKIPINKSVKTWRTSLLSGHCTKRRVCMATSKSSPSPFHFLETAFLSTARFCVAAFFLLILSATGASAQNTLPTGVPTISGTLIEGRELTADTSGISDADGPDPLPFTYQWNRNDGTTDTAISGADSATYTLTQDDVGEMITVTVRYTDANNTNESLTSAPTSAITANMPPTANAGSNQRWGKGTEVTLDGTGSDDPDGDNAALTYLWERTAGATTVTLSDTTAAQPTFTIPTLIPSSVPASYTFRLIVSDGQASSAAATVRIFIRPLFQATIANQTFSVGNAITPITLPEARDGPNSLPSTNTYTLAPLPAGLAFDPASRTLSGTPSNLGTYNPVYTATNGDGDTDSLSFSIEVTTNTPPTTTGLTATTAEDTPYTFAAGNFNFDDAESGDSLQQVRIATLPASTSGSLALNGTLVTVPQEIAVADIPNLVYTPALNVNGAATFTFSVSDGTAFSTTATATITVTAVNDPPIIAQGLTVPGLGLTGGPRTFDLSSLFSDIDGDALTYTVSISNGSVAFVTVIAGSVLNIAPRNEGTTTITITADDGNGGTAEQVVTVTVVEALPTAVITSNYDSLVRLESGFEGVDGGVTITFDGSASFDPSGAPLTYRWEMINSDNTGVDLVGTEAIFEFTTPPRMVGRVQMFQFTLVVTNTVTNFSSPGFPHGLPPIVNVTVLPTGANNDPTGSPTITGSLSQGQTLTASRGDIQDPDGLVNVVFSYQWNRHDAGMDTPISGATGSSYRLTPDDVDELITVTASYRDNQRTDESVTSAPVGPVAAPALPPSAVITSNYDSLVRLNNGSRGVDGGVTIRFDGSGSSDPGGGSLIYSWRLLDTETGGFTELGTEATFEYTTPSRMTESQDFLIYLVVTNTANLSSPGLADSETISVFPDSSNAPPSGLPTVSGNATLGATLTVNTSGISDADGPANLSFTYQWNTRVGSTDTPISGATGNSYQLTPDEVGELITVTALYTDNQITDESVTSDPVGPVALAGTGANTPPTSSGLSATINEDTSYTFATGDFTFNDADGDSLQRVRIDTLPGSGSLALNNVAVILGQEIAATAIPNLVYTPGANVNGTDSFTYSVSDGTDFSATFATATIAINAVNDDPTGEVTISGILAEGQTLTANTDSISDADGPASLSFTYQWFAGTSQISGANMRTYTPTQGNVGQMISVDVSYMDANGIEGGFFSGPVGPVLAANAPPVAVVTSDYDSLVSTTLNFSGVDGGVTITFDGSGSFDPSGAPLTYRWETLNSASTGVVVVGTEAIFEYTTPPRMVGRVQVFQFALVVTNTVSNVSSPNFLSGNAPITSVSVWPDGNNDPTGSPTITGNPTQGRILTASPGDIQDTNGLTNVVFSYQWNRHDAGTDTPISGATGDSYRLTPADVGEEITVTASYRDNQQTDESVTSAPVGPVAAPSLPPSAVVTSNYDSLVRRDSGEEGVDGGVTIRFDGSASSDPGGGSLTYSWRLLNTETGGFTELGTEATFEYTTPTRMAQAQNFLIQLIVTNSAGISSPELANPEVVRVLSDSGNTPPTGLPTISGNAAVGATLTADTDGISDADGPDPLSFTYQWFANDGTTNEAISGATSATYILTPDEMGDQITVTVSYTDAGSTDETLTSAPTIAVAASSTSNTPPTSSGLTVSTEEDTAHSFAAAEFTFADADGDALHSLRIDTLPATGSLTLDGAAVIAGDVIPAAGIGTLVYTPAANATGDVSFTFSLSDDSDGTTFGATATATVTIDAVNDAPTTSGLTVSTQEDTAHSFTAGEFNFADADGDDLDSLRIDTLPATGSLTLDGTAVTAGDVIAAAGISNLVYTPAENATGDDTFTFSLSDGTAFGATATATVSIGAENDAPTTSGLAVSTQEDTAHSFTAGEFNFTDADGDALDSLRIDTLPATGNLTLDGTAVTAGDVIAAAGISNLVYTPAENATGDVTFTFSLSDGTVFGATATATVTVTAVNDAPTADAGADQAVAEGASVTLNGSGNDPENASLSYTWTQTSGTPMVTLTDADTATPTFTAPENLLADAVLVFSLIVNDGVSDSSAATVTITTTAGTNDPPTADAGVDQTVAEGASVTLNGSGNDPENANLSYTWTQASGTPMVTLTDADTATPTFTAPENLLADAVLVFSLIVNDGVSDSQAATVTITTTAGTNDPPTADAGVDQTVAEGASVTLNGSGNDPENANLSYTWTQASGTPMVTLTDADTATPTFTAPENLLADAVLVFSLIVNDGVSDSQAATVTITTTAGTNDPPTADAGVDQTVAEGASVTLNGSGNDPENANLSYTWTQASGTPMVTLTDADTATPTFTAPENLLADAVLVFSLIVNDGVSDSQAATVTITTTAGQNDPPTADAGVDQTVAEGVSVTLNGSGNDPENANLSYTWTQASGTPMVTLTDADTATPTFTAPENLLADAVLVFSLIVNDGVSDSQAATVTITTTAGQNDPPTADAGVDQTVAEGASVTLNGSGNDPENANLSYTWTQASGTPMVTLTDADTATPTFTAPENLLADAVLVFSLIVNDGVSDSQAATVTITTTAGQNDPPTADAGVDQTVAEGASVTLNGSGNDPENANLSYTWTQASGTPMVTLTDADTATPTFTAPENLLADAVLVFSLIVNDGVSDSQAATVTITTTAGQNDPPTADAGVDQTVAEGASVTLNGSGNDPENANLSYTWTQASGTPMVTLTDADTATPTFTAPENLLADAVLVFSLIVNDGVSDSQAATVTITTTAGQNDPPTADAGVDQTVAEGASVTLNGSGNDPENANLSYTWTQASGTPMVTLTDADTATPTFTAPENLLADAVLVFSLIVNDGVSDSQAATVTITTTATPNNPPTTNAPLTVPGLSLAAGEQTVDLSNGFSDADGDMLSYEAESEDEDIVTVSVAGSTLTITPVGAGTATLTLRANDGNGGTVEQTVMATVGNSAPTTSTTITVSALTVAGGEQTVELSNGFSDADGDMLSYEAESDDEDIVTVAVAGSMLTITPVGAGTATLTLRANDGNGGTVEQMVMATVGNSAPTTSTTITVPALTVAGGEQTVDLNSGFIDPDGDTLSYEAESDDEDIVTVAVAGSMLTITPVGNGTATLTLRANDGNGGTVEQTVMATVGNSAPTTSTTITVPALTVAGGEQTVELSNGFSDADGDMLSYEAESDDEDIVTVSVAGSTLTITPVGNGTATLTLRANDGNGGTVEQTVMATVGNSAPTTSTTITVPALTVAGGEQTVELSNGFSDADGDTLSYEAESDDEDIVTVSVAGSTLTIIPVGNGTATLTLRANDGNGGMVEQTVMATVGNSAPTTSTTITVPALTVAGGEQTVDLNSGFIDPDGDMLSYEAESDDEDIVTVAVAGSMLTITPVGAGTATLTLRANDGNGGMVEQTVMATVGNSAPTTSTTITVPALTVAGGEQTVDLNSGFIDPDGDMLSYEAESDDEDIVTVSVAGSTLTIIPVGNGTATLTLRANDGNGGMVEQTVMATVGNSAPTTSTTITVPALTVAGGEQTVDLNSGFSDPDGDTLSYEAESDDEDTVTVSVAGSTLTIIPVGNGTATLTLRANDGNGGMVEQTVMATVGNSAPTTSTTITVPALTVAGGEQTVDLNSGFIDPDGDMLSYEAESDDEDIVTVSVAGSTLTIIPVGNGTATLTLRANDGNGGMVEQTVMATVGNSAPTTSTTITVPALTVAGGEQTVDLNSGFSDPDGDTLSYEAESDDEDTVTVSVAGSTLTIIPVGNGTATLTLRANDGNGGTVEQTVMATVGNSAPTTSTTITVPALTVAGGEQTVDLNSGFIDPDGDMLSYEAESDDEDIVTVSVAGSTLTIIPVGNGTATLTLRANDGNGGMVEQTVMATVGNSAPTTSTTITVPALTVAGGEQTVDLNSGFSDPDGDTLSYEAESDDEDTVTVSVAGSTLTIIPVGNGTATLTLRANDGNGGMVEQTVMATVGNSAPTTSTTITVPALTVAGGEQTVDLNSGFIDPDGDTLSYEAESDDEDTVTVSVAGSMLTITPVGNGTATLTLRANDGNGGTVEQTVMATVGNSAPTSSGLAVRTNEDIPHTFAVVDFPFTDADGDSLQQVRIDTLPATGSLTLNGTEVTAPQEIAVADIPDLVYTPAANANGMDSFDFSVSDGTDFSESSTAVLTIEASNDPATGLPTITGTANEGEELTADVSGIEDIDGLPELSMFTYQWNTRVGSTDTPINNATTETYTPTDGEVGEFITVTVIFTDGGGTRESLTSESTMEVTDIVRVLTMDEALRLNAEPPTTDTTGSIVTLSTSEEVILDNANGEDFDVTSTLNGETIPHEVTDIRAGSIVLEVTPAIGFGSLIGVSYSPVQGSITGAVTGNPVVPFSISVNNAVRPLNEDLDRDGRKTLLTHLTIVQSDLVISTVQNHLRALDGGNRVSVPRHAVVETEGEGKYVEYENVREMLSHLEFDLSLNSLMGSNEEWRKTGISSAGLESSLAPVVGTDLSSPRTLTLWGGGGETRLDNDYNTSGDDNRYDGRVWSYNTGLDYRPSESLTLGAAVGYLDSELTTTYNEGTYDEKMVSVSPYLLYESPWGLDISLFGGYGIGDVDLTGTFGQASTPFVAFTDSNLLFGAVRVSGAMKFLDNSLEVVPNVSLLGSRKRLEGYTDSSNREIGETTASVLRLTPGFEVSYRVKFSGVTLRPFASGGLIFDLLDTVNDDDMTYSVGGGMRFETEMGLSGSVEGQRELGREAVEQRRFVGTLSYGIAVGRNGRAGTVTPSVGINHASGDDVSAEGLSQAYVLEYTTRGGGHSISFEHDRSEEEGARSGLGYRYGAEIMPGLNLEATVSSPNVEKREVKGFVGMKLRF